MQRVRPAVEADADAMGRVHVASWAEAHGHLVSPALLAALDAGERADMWRGAVARHPGLVHVAESGGDVVGLAAAGEVEDGPRRLELRVLYLLASHHGSGLGQALLDAALGDRPASLWVAEDNPRARAFYHRNGFRPDGARRHVDAWEGMVIVRLVR